MPIKYSLPRKPEYMIFLTTRIRPFQRPPDCLTLSELQDRWGLKTIFGIRALIKKGQLQVHKRQPKWLYITLESIKDTEEMGLVPRTRVPLMKHQAEAEVTAYRLFDEGCSIKEVSQRLVTSRRIVKNMFKRYTEMQELDEALAIARKKAQEG